MVRTSFISLVALVIILSSCTPPALPVQQDLNPTVPSTTDPSPTRSPFAPLAGTMTVTPSSTTAPFPTSVPPTIPVRPSYTLTAGLDYAAHFLSVDESIVYQNATGEITHALILAVEPNLWANCFKADVLLVDGQPQPEVTVTGNRMEVPLSMPLVPGGVVNLSLHYDLRLPPADSYHVFGYNPFQVNLVDWYPFIVPYSQGWLLHPPANVGEHLVYDMADFDVTLFTVDRALPVVLAASGPAQNGASSLHYSLQNARTFVFSASTAYQKGTSTIAGVTVISYYFIQEKAAATAALDAVTKAISIFAETFGPFPHPQLSVVKSPFFDGMEYDGLFFLSRNYYTSYKGTLLNNLVDIAVHETAHQWWFSQVGNDQALQPWLDEALATYSEELFYERSLPQISAWWKFRVENFAPGGWVDTDIYHGKSFRTYANAVYLRGAQFLQAVRSKIGDAAFMSFLKDYAAQMSGKRSTSADFFRILRDNTPSDISTIVSSLLP